MKHPFKFLHSYVWCTSGLSSSTILFAVFLYKLSDTCNLDRNRFIVVYADDILLISPFVVNLENLIHLCERELKWLDMAINYKNLVAYVLDHDVMSHALILLA